MCVNYISSIILSADYPSIGLLTNFEMCTHCLSRFLPPMLANGTDCMWIWLCAVVVVPFLYLLLLQFFAPIFICCIHYLGNVFLFLVCTFVVRVCVISTLKPHILLSILTTKFYRVLSIQLMRREYNSLKFGELCHCLEKWFYKQIKNNCRENQGLCDGIFWMMFGLQVMLSNGTLFIYNINIFVVICHVTTIC